MTSTSTQRYRLLNEDANLKPDTTNSNINLAKINTSYTLDPIYGGQFGYAPNLEQWINNQAYTRRNLVPILLEYPAFFDAMNDPQRWIKTLKSMVETHCRTIDGLNATLTVDVADHPVGGGGEVQEEFVNVTRARSQPKFSFVEKYGRPFQTFLYHWITYGMMDPDTKYALYGTLAGGGTSSTIGNTGASRVRRDMLADMYTMTMLFIEPDPMHRKVVNSWLTTNMFPKGTGDIVAKRDMTAAAEIVTLDIEFTGLSQTGVGVNIFAQQILDNINIENANPYLRKAFMDGINSNITANYNSGNTGYKTSVDSIISQAAPNTGAVGVPSGTTGGVIP